MSWLAAFAGFAALIILHEAGHFAAAKAVGMRVERFMLFFPPIAASFRRGETEYGIGLIPLGGYVKISGMNPREELPPEVAHRAYYRQAPWKRIVVILAGPAVNVLLAFVILWAIFLGHGQVDGSTQKVAAVQKGSPAATALKIGDQVVAVDGVRGDPEQLRRLISGHGCAGGSTRPGCRAQQPMTVTVRRDGADAHLHAAAALRRAGEAPAARLRVRAAVRSGVGAGEAASLSVTRMWEITKGTVSAIGRLFYSEQARKQVSGVVGAYDATRQSFTFDAVQAFLILAIVSLSLAIVNLFPFLPLDGGHVFWALAEKVRGRPISFSVMERAGLVGFLLVGLLFAIGLTNDIERLRGTGFGVR